MKKVEKINVQNLMAFLTICVCLIAFGCAFVLQANQPSKKVGTTSEKRLEISVSRAGSSSTAVT